MHIEKNKNKDGKVISFRVTVYLGKDSFGKEIRRKKTFKIPSNITPSKVDKFIQKESVLFEKECLEITENSSNKMITFKEFSSIALDIKRREGLKRSTLNRYEELLERINDYMGSLNLEQIKPNVLDDFYKSLGSVGANKKNGGPLSAKTIKEHHNLISGIFEIAIDHEYVVRNPARGAHPPKVKKREAECFDLEVLTQIRECLSREPIKWQALINLFALIGGRRGEFIGLKWEAVDFEENLISLHLNVLYSPKDGIYDDDLKNEYSNRVIKLPSSVMELLKEYKSWQDALIERLGDSYNNQGYMFTQIDGRPMHPDSPNGYLKKFAQKYDLPHINPHKFRHSVASILIAEGTDVVTVSKYLGHSSPTVTSSVYAHSFAKQRAKAAEILAEKLIK